jgi:hypothetical protein
LHNFAPVTSYAHSVWAKPGAGSTAGPRPFMISPQTSRTSDELLATTGKLYWRVPVLAWKARVRSDDLLPVVRGGSPVRVRGEFVEFSSSLVRVIWHNVSQLWVSPSY